MVESICPPGLDSNGEGAEEGGMARKEGQGSRKGEDGEGRRVGGARFGEGVSMISCICLNARSIMNKMDEFMALMDVLRPDVVGVTESWAKEEVDEAELVIGGYVLFRKDRSSAMERRGGGVLLYVREELSPVEFHTTTEYPEHVWCRLGDNRGEVCWWECVTGPHQWCLIVI